MSGHALDPFLDAWAAQGGRDGPDLRLRVYRAVAAMPDRDMLADTLRAVLAWDAADRARFERVYATFFRASLASTVPEGFDAAEALAALKECAGDAAYQRDESADEDGEETGGGGAGGGHDRREGWVLPAAAVAVGLLAAALTAGIAARSWGGGETTRDGGAEASVEAGAGGGRAAAGDSSAGVCDAALEDPSDAAVATPVVATQPAAPPPRERGRVWGTTDARGPWWLTWLLAMASSGAAASAVARWRSARRAEEDERRAAAQRQRDQAEAARRREAMAAMDSPEHSEPDYRADAPALPFDARGEERIAWAAGFARADDATELDARRTVAESARRVGVFSPVYRPRMVTAGVTLVVPDVLDAVAAALVDAVARALRLRHVPVEVTRDARGVAGAELALVFVDARNPYTVPLHRWWRHPRVAAVELRDPWLWGEEVEALAVDGAPVRVHEPTAEGVAAALLAASRGLRGEAARRVRWDDDPESVGAAFPLAAACSLCEPCDLATVDALRRRFTPGLPFMALQRIVAMEGVHTTSGGWTFTRALREHLRARVGERFCAEVLAWQSARLEELAAKEGTRAAAVLGRERALVSLQHARAAGDARGEATARKALAAYEADEATRARLHERLEELGEAAREAVGARGAGGAPPTRGWRAYAAEVVCAAACAAGAAWSVAAGVRTEPVTATRVEGPTCPAGMVLIRGGTFRMGSPEGVGDEDEHPAHEVTVATFCIDRTEVSVAEYRACVAAGACTAPDAYRSGRGSSDNFCNWGRPCADEHPVNCLDWQQARTYCTWRGNPRGEGRLLREAEWEFAARGTTGRTYPWGEATPDGTRVNLCGEECVAHARSVGREGWRSIDGWRDPFGGTAPVMTLGAGATPEGVLHLAGNVWEWIDDEYVSDAYAQHTPEGHLRARDSELSTERVLRGGSWPSDVASVARAANRGRIGPSLRRDIVGVRCARGAR